MRILLTGGGGVGSRVLYHQLGDVHLADANPLKPDDVATERWHVVPMATDVHYRDALAALCRTLAIDLLIPGIDEELLLLGMMRDWRVWPCDLLLPDTSFISDHQDKLRSMRELAKLGLAAPVTERLEVRTVPFPCVVKPRQGRGSLDVLMAASQADIDAHLVACGRGAKDFVVQEQIKGQEYTVTMVADLATRLRAIVPVRVIEKAGVTTHGEAAPDAVVIRACQQIHDAKPTSGVYNIQGIKTEDWFVPFEINPRVSTTTCVAIEAGVDVIGLAQDAGYFDGRLASFQPTTMRRLEGLTTFGEAA